MKCPQLISQPLSSTRLLVLSEWMDGRTDDECTAHPIASSPYIALYSVLTGPFLRACSLAWLSVGRIGVVFFYPFRVSGGAGTRQHAAAEEDEETMNKTLDVLGFRKWLFARVKFL